MNTRVACAAALLFAVLAVLGADPAFAQSDDAPKADTPKVDAPKVDAPKVDAPKVETPKSDAPKTDTAKPAAATPPSDATGTDGHSGTKPAPSSMVPRFAPWNCDADAAALPEPGASADAGGDMVHWNSALDASRTVDRLAPKLEHIRIVSPTDFVPSTGPFSMLIFKTFIDRDAVAKDGTPLDRLTYRALIVGDPFADCAAASVRTGSLSQVIWPEGAWSERATRGTASAPGTDFKPDEAPQDKTLLHVDANVQRMHGLWSRARIYVIGSAGADGSDPKVIGSFETVVANRTWAAVFAILGCIVAYVIAAFATFAVHQTRRVYDDDGNEVRPAAPAEPAAVPPAQPVAAPQPLVPPDVVPGALAQPLLVPQVAPRVVVQPAVAPRIPAPRIADRLKSSFQNQAAQIDKGHGPLVGTNYKTIWAHIFNPVVLTAGSNGLGNATNLQILFFSLIVFGLVTHIWMMTGHLTGLSQTIVLLMGISGIGGTAAAGADLAKNRLSFDNWTWLVNRGWLPKGGIAEVNAAKWKDIFTTNGTFDVYHFQMVWFSVVVGVSLIGVGAQVSDLSTFEVPSALLGILGLSQVVYVTGKLVAPPSISDLDAQIGKLRDEEDALRLQNDAAAATAAGGSNVVSWATDVAAVQAYDEYAEGWRLTRTMFETTVGSLVPESAIGKRPPFPLTDAIVKRLPDAAVRQAYRQVVSLIGYPPLPVIAPVAGAVDGAGAAVPVQPAPAPASFQWKLLPPDEDHRYPSRLTVTPDGDGSSAIVAFDAAGVLPGNYRFAVRITAPAPGPAIVREFALGVIDPAAVVA